MTSDDAEPTIVQSGGGQVLDFLGVTHKLTSEDSGGAYYLFETAFDPGTGNGLHIHRREDEVGYVLEGALEVRLGDRTVLLETGGVARLPKGVPHAIRNPLDMLSRYLFLVVPGGLDRWFDAVAHAQSAGTLDDGLFRALSADYGLEWVEEPWPRSTPQPDQRAPTSAKTGPEVPQS